MADTLEQQSEIYGGSEDASSVCEEERVKKLFQACDGDGDGYIDSQDLLMMCRELNLEDSVEDLMRELGADEQGRISYEEFLRCRLALRPEIDALRSETQQKLRGTPEYLPTSSDNSLGAASAGKHESWEFDSGARDLSPEPHALQKLVEAAGGSLAAGSTSGMFELANKLHLAALTSLKGEILDLSSRLHAVTQERDILEERLAKTQMEKAHALSEAEERSELQSQRYEEQLTELHSVIAELRRKLDHQRANVIREEEDIASDNEEHDMSHEAEGSTTNLVDDSELQDGDVDSSSNEGNAGTREGVVGPGSSSEERGQVEGEADPTALQQEAGTLTPPRSERHEQSRATCHLPAAGSSNQRCSLAEELAMACGGLPEHRSAHKKVESGCVAIAECCAVPTCSNNLAVVPQDDMPVCKVAERITLRRIEHQITGSQLATLGVSHTPVAESLVSELQAADVAELGRTELASRLEIEREQLSARLEHARAQSRVLSLALDESRAQAEHLALLVGKYESNATALRLALSYSDRAIEAYDVLVALLESELGLLLASCRSLGLASLSHPACENLHLDGADKSTVLKQARDNRRTSETVAKHVLARLDNVAVSVGASHWEDFPHVTSGTVYSDGEWSQSDERRLRDHIVRLKTERGAVRGTVLELESFHVEPPGARMSLADACKLDLETAVLMQELMAVREDKAELRAKVYLLEKDKASLDLKLSAQEVQIQHLQAQVQEGPFLSRVPGSESEGEGSDDASRREARLRERMLGLVATLEKVSKNSEMRHQQSVDLINNLKRANSALLQTLDRSKKKYQSRIKKLEQKMLDMGERHTHEVRILKQRLADLEEELLLSRSNQCPMGFSGVTPHSSTASETSL